MNQTERILRHLEAFGSITAAEAAAEFGCMRLASRVNDLKKAGYPIRREMVTGRNRFGEAVAFARYFIDGR
ncbi:MAG: helix-turn-helix domain-containing protein [Candidatus Faecousia sp.]|nr:helix-turn-helix domain-containing protein [Candidatus Faecousia sp.]